ncbi:MAG: DUF1285 domain-containing protein [Gammaproteobacteria bacterium]|uniref:DUF1285 domain-containing protein n=1 Tax=SAR86 cluster bacterium TaxID=2030880 RepID=A0A368C4D9_9GAMM|nr:MAG: DUF1285 domain-containing protein [SAR86 cluster bacterium]RPG41381.1 MAG: DUF1285 domain-containing protein [Gammaproteobacteria bacterium TMED186]|tara:strand:- start:1986 stop:2531 length:546 start_codon:yes stop_codon:yes gene_type:complete
MSIDNILQSLSKYKEDNFPPVHLWNPELCTNASFSIDIKGDWYYNNSIIGRMRLKKLFSTILKREGDDYFLVTPVEKIKLDVEIAPYLIVDFTYDHINKEIILDTNFDYSFPLNDDHKLELKLCNENHYPIVNVRSGIEGLITRSVYYKLIDIAAEQKNNSKKNILILESFKTFHELGSIA